MTSAGKWISCVTTALLLLAAAPARAQVASLGKGWLLDTFGTVTSAPGEVITGHDFYSYDAKYLAAQGATALFQRQVDSQCARPRALAAGQSSV